MKYYLFAGEASGDLHASNLMKGLKKFDPAADFRFFGGDLMAKVGGRPMQHFKDLAVMGFFSVLANIRSIARNLRFFKKDISIWKPDAVILVDYAGFNLRIARYAHENNFTVYYYISPKVWAWNKSRIEKLRKYTDRIFVIFPFEVDYFRQNGLEVEYYGNPLLDPIEQFRQK